MSSRFVSTQPGITSWHSFSAGAHYDPDNVAFGAVIGLDEHRVEPGAGFDWHGHRGVHIVTRVLDGTLRHEDSSGEVHLVGPGEFLVQSTGNGVRHKETNASETEPLRFLQLTLLASHVGPPYVRQEAGPVEIDGSYVDVGLELPSHRPSYVFAVEIGEDLRLGDPSPVLTPPGELFIVRMPKPLSENRE